MWYYIIDGIKYGPLTTSEVEIRVIGGIINHKMKLLEENTNYYKELSETEFYNLIRVNYEKELHIEELDIYLYSDTEALNYFDLLQDEFINDQNKEEKFDSSSITEQEPLSCDDESLRGKLWDACWEGSLDSVKELVESGAPWCGSSEHSSCLRAAMRGGLEVLRYLISRLEGRYEEEKFKCFKIACVNGMFEKAKFFLEEGALLRTDVVYYLTNYIQIQHENYLNNHLDCLEYYYNILDICDYLINENIIQSEILKKTIDESRVLIKIRKEETEKIVQEYLNTDEYKENKEYQRVAEIGPSRFSLPGTVKKYKINNVEDIEEYQSDFEVKIQEGDEIWVFTSPTWTWEMMCGNSYSELRRDGKVIDTGVEIMN